jgi:hypothetical protein
VISIVDILTSHDSNRDPGMIVWFCQEPIADSVTGRHLIKMSPEDRGGSEREDTREELTTIERGANVSETETQREIDKERFKVRSEQIKDRDTHLSPDL